MKFREKLGWVIGLLVLLGGCLQSCVTQRKVEKYLNNNPLFASEWCGTKYPVKERLIKGKDSIIEKTVEVKGDSVDCPPQVKGNDTIRVKVKCPDQKIVYHNVYRTDTVEKENTAKLNALQLRYNELVKNYAVEKDNRLEAEYDAKKWMWWFIGLVGIVGIGILMKLKGWLPF